MILHILAGIGSLSLSFSVLAGVASFFAGMRVEEDQDRREIFGLALSAIAAICVIGSIFIGVAHSTSSCP